MIYWFQIEYRSGSTVYDCVWVIYTNRVEIINNINYILIYLQYMVRR
jgi:hypothetical protein